LADISILSRARGILTEANQLSVWIWYTCIFESTL